MIDEREEQAASVRAAAEAEATPVVDEEGSALAETQQLSTGDPGTMVLPTYADERPGPAAEAPSAERPAEPTEAQSGVSDEPPTPRSRRSVRSAPIDLADPPRR